MPPPDPPENPEKPDRPDSGQSRRPRKSRTPRKARTPRALPPSAERGQGAAGSETPDTSDPAPGGQGRSDPPRFAGAVTEAATAPAIARALSERIEHDLAGAAADLILVWASGEHVSAMPRLQRALRKRFDPKVILGISTRGVIGPRTEIEHSDGTGVLAASLPGVTLTSFDSRELEAMADHARRSGDSSPWAGTIVLADPYSTSTLRLLPAIRALAPGAPVIGGMASAADRPRGNMLMLNGKILDQGSVGVALTGPIGIDCTISQGCRPIGRPYVITRAKRQVVLELGGHPALSIVEQITESLAEDERELARDEPLMVGRVIDEYKQRFGRGDFLIRPVVGVDQQHQAIAIGDPQVRVGQTIQFHLRDRRTAEDDLRLLLELQKLRGPAAGAMLVSCPARGQGLFHHAHSDARLVADALEDPPLAGFFADGQFGPTGSDNFLHAHTLALAVFRHVSSEPPPQS